VRTDKLVRYRPSDGHVSVGMYVGKSVATDRSKLIATRL
jgi:hypothetical protein